MLSMISIYNVNNVNIDYSIYRHICAYASLEGQGLGIHVALSLHWAQGAWVWGPAGVIEFPFLFVIVLGVLVLIFLVVLYSVLTGG